MPINHDKKILFVHINRTGGKSINNMFGFENDGHYSLDRLCNKCKGGSDDYFKFSFVRNPWSRAVSQFLHWKENLGRIKDEVNFKQYIKNIEDFEQWTIGSSGGMWKRKYFRSQLEWFGDQPEKLDFIGLFENFNEDILQLFDQIDMDVFDDEIVHINSSSLEDYRSYYDDETREIVYDVCKKDVDYFGYSFE